MGGNLTAITDGGNISTGSCYSEHSRFITLKGNLDLQNVHKTSEIVALGCQYANITGFHGNLQARLNGGKLNFQLSELHGDSFIDARNPSSFIANISEYVEQHTCLSIAANIITLDPSINVSNMRRNNTNGLDTLESGNPDNISSRLTIQTNSKLQLGKLSWMKTILKKLEATVTDKNSK